MGGSSKQEAYKKLRRSVSAYAGAFTTKLRRSLSSRGNKASGELLSSIKSRVVKKFSGKGDMIVGFEIRMKGYGNFINRNLHPKRMPSIDAIIEWMTSKGIKPRRNAKGRFMSKKQAAYLIGRSIQKKGFDTYNKHGVGWMDIVWIEEQKRLRKKARKDLLAAVKSITSESLTYNRTSRGQSKTFF